MLRRECARVPRSRIAVFIGDLILLDTIGIDHVRLPTSRTDVSEVGRWQSGLNLFLFVTKVGGSASALSFPFFIVIRIMRVCDYTRMGFGVEIFPAMLSYRGSMNDPSRSMHGNAFQ